MQSVRTLNSSLPSINQSKIALLTTGNTASQLDFGGGAGSIIGRSNSNINATNSSGGYNAETDQYVVNFDELVKRNPTLDNSTK